MDKNFKAGIVSVTFRQYEYKEFIEYTKLTDLSCIEWNSEAHVPYNEPEKAQAVRNEMRENNLVTTSYGSYYYLGQPYDPEVFSMILETAKKLSAPMIRVWGGITGSENLNEQDRKNIIDDTLRIAEKAKEDNIDISLEYHSNTITDTIDSALDFIKEVRKQGGENVYLYWQSKQNKSFEENRQELIKICPYLSNIHVFAWENTERFSLIKHKERWEIYIKIIKDSGGNHNFLLEFVKGDEVGQMVEDAKVLTELLD